MNIVFDIGGTNTRVGGVHNELLTHVKMFPTAETPDEGFAKVVAVAREILDGAAPSGVCGCVSGTIVEGVVMGANSLVLWNGFPIVEKFSREFGVAATIYNDAVLVGIGEQKYGAGRGFRDLLYVTVSTGVGKAHIVDGQPKDDEPLAAAALLANLLYVDSVVSGTAVARQYNIHPKQLSDISIRNSLAEQLGRGLVPFVQSTQPEVLILGGSMMVGENPIPIEKVSEVLLPLLAEQGFSKKLVIKKAELGSVGGLWGGIAYLRHI